MKSQIGFLNIVTVIVTIQHLRKGRWTIMFLSHKSCFHYPEHWYTNCLKTIQVYALVGKYYFKLVIVWLEQRAQLLRVHIIMWMSERSNSFLIQNTIPCQYLLGIILSVTCSIHRSVEALGILIVVSKLIYFRLLEHSLPLVTFEWYRKVTA